MGSDPIYFRPAVPIAHLAARGCGCRILAVAAASQRECPAHRGKLGLSHPQGDSHMRNIPLAPLSFLTPLLLACLLSSSLCAQVDPAAANHRSISTSGEAVVYVVPD